MAVVVLLLACTAMAQQPAAAVNEGPAMPPNEIIACIRLDRALNPQLAAATLPTVDLREIAFGVEATKVDKKAPRKIIALKEWVDSAEKARTLGCNYLAVVYLRTTDDSSRTPGRSIFTLIMSIWVRGPLKNNTGNLTGSALINCTDEQCMVEGKRRLLERTGMEIGKKILQMDKAFREYLAKKSSNSADSSAP